MARNSEKAQSMLFRFRAAQAADLGILDIGRTRRPKRINEIESIPVCEKWRSQVLKDISRKVSKIQDEALSIPQIRDLNDEINDLMKEKWRWEKQIRDLGGPNYMRGGRVVDEHGKEVPGGGKGYRYYGRARELPGVKELFEAAARPDPQADGIDRTANRANLSRMVDASYYGYNLDEEDGTLLAYEKAKEEEAFNRLMRDAEQEVVLKAKDGGGGSGLKRKASETTDGEWEELPGDVGDGVRWRLPTAEEVEEELLDRRRRRLLDKLG